MDELKLNNPVNTENKNGVIKNKKHKKNRLASGDKSLYTKFRNGMRKDLFRGR
jgi:hypothetical protein